MTVRPGTRRHIPEQRQVSMRHLLLAAARAQISEHGIAGRTAIKEVQAVAKTLSAADLGGKRISANNPFIPAYKSRLASGALVIEFRCPHCSNVHAHGLPDNSPVQYRVSHCAQDFGHAHGYRLLVVGWRPAGDLPSCSAAEIDALNDAICESE